MKIRNHKHMFVISNFHVPILTPLSKQATPEHVSIIYMTLQRLLFCKRNVYTFLTYETEFVIFSGAGKFCIAHVLRQLTRDVKHVVRTLNFRSDSLSYQGEKKQMMFGKGRYATSNVKNERNDR